MRPDEEVWRQIKDWPHYEVSNLGRVRRSAPGKRTRVGLVLTPRNKGRPECSYKCVCLTHEGYRKDVRIHVLVCEAFHGPRPTPEHVAAHLNGHNHDNRSNNLIWATPKENERHKLEHGRRQMGERQWCSKLTESDIRVIRQLMADGVRAKIIAKRFNIDVSNVYLITHRKAWRQVA